MFVTLLLPAFAQAHPGAFGHTHGFIGGLAHPLTGLDHVCAMIAVGLWAVQCGGRATGLLPLTFMAFMIAGGVLGLSGVPMIGVEPGIAASVLVFGLMISGAIRLPLPASLSLAGGFALFHGYAHGAEMTNTSSPLTYCAGFILATGGLHLFGIALALLSKKYASAQWIRLAGTAVAGCGVYFFLSF